MPILYILATVVLYIVFAVVRRHSKLSHVPGPFLASCSGFWLAWKFWREESFRKISQSLHARYGPIVRYGPKNVLFSDPSAIPVVYGTTKPFRKVSW